MAVIVPYAVPRTWAGRINATMGHMALAPMAYALPSQTIMTIGFTCHH